MTLGKRRAPGTLEAEILAELWSAGSPLTAEQVRHRLGDGIAHTTVTTILTRLHDKGAVEREAWGRSYAYHPVLDQQGLVARRMAALLDGQQDPSAVLSRFVATLDAKGLRALRRALRAKKDALG